VIRHYTGYMDESEIDLSIWLQSSKIPNSSPSSCRKILQVAGRQVGCTAYPAQTSVFIEGERAERFYIVRRGTVVVYRRGEGERLDEMARFEAGDVVGDFDFSRRAVYDAMARAEDETELVAFPAYGLNMDDLARERPDIAARILLRSVAMISSRVRSTQATYPKMPPGYASLRRQMYTDSATGLWVGLSWMRNFPRLWKHRPPSYS
jgi:CRP-like cAMP-binding protein